jgi:DNA-binding response OmpR family regulator
MMKHSGVTLSHMKLLRSVWGLEYGGEPEYLRTYVYMLRKQIGILVDEAAMVTHLQRLFNPLPALRWLCQRV